MEFANHPSAPFIADAVSEQDWARQHVDQQTHMTDSKGSGLLPLRRRSAVALKRRASSDARHRPEDSPSGVSKRRRVERPVRVTSKPLSPADRARSAADWEQMLKLSTNNLQGLYAGMMDKNPAPAAGLLLGDRFPQRVADSDRNLMASRAMHHAAGCCSEGGLDDDDACSSSSGEDTADWAESDSSSDDQPATPDTAQMDEDSDVDGELGIFNFHMAGAS
ncbi:hypothetical protein KVR01_013727 [Diaporthe batatas]|uniref:uncharacterized protein n=1 Tax=Diaporthe batatas TaxID=748121 RepID=UPI001D03BA7E|nr:uncharacterized protein KVR01_013727 [Diaporthe batatas]KAG8156386.1 hypothetical protein KVR01_013727 [Diaporthe batatas]